MNIIHKALQVFWKHISRVSYNVFHLAQHLSYLHGKKVSK